MEGTILEEGSSRLYAFGTEREHLVLEEAAQAIGLRTFWRPRTRSSDVPRTALSFCWSGVRNPHTKKRASRKKLSGRARGTTVSTGERRNAWIVYIGPKKTLVTTIGMAWTKPAPMAIERGANRST